MLRNKKSILILTLLIFYLVGTIGILTPTKSAYFLTLSPFNLILSFTIMLLARERNKLQFILFLALCFIVGLGVEFIGTKTAYLFGHYYYGANLGYKFESVPLIIGLNWGILVVTSASIIQRLKISLYLKIILSALLMTALDGIMEPVAIESDFWHWKTEHIPLYNYICWFLISSSLQTVYFKLKLAESNKVFDSLFIILVLFFSILLIV